MRCVCCGGSMVRGNYIPDVIRFVRFVDHFCQPCGWVIPRESLLEAVTLPKQWCPEHGSEKARKKMPLDLLHINQEE